MQVPNTNTSTKFKGHPHLISLLTPHICGVQRLLPKIKFENSECFRKDLVVLEVFLLQGLLCYRWLQQPRGL